MCAFIPFKLYGKDFRYYDEERIECEFRNKHNDWRPMTITNQDKNYKIIQFNIDKKHHKMRLHRVIYYAHNQDWDIYNTKNNCIDHIHHPVGEPLDNSIANLRVVTNQQNGFNRNVKGYSWDKVYNKWKAKICINGKNIHLGYFDNELDARDAYLDGKAIYHII